MKQQLPEILKSVLAGICFILLVLTVIPADTGIHITPAPKTKSDTTTASQDDYSVSDPATFDPGDIAELFGWIRPTKPPPPLPTAIPTKEPTPTCIPAGFLKFITKFKDEKDILWYIFRDIRNNSTIKITKGTPDQGWELISESDTFFTFRKNGEINCAPK
jgi:hypothetical protein